MYRLPFAVRATSITVCAMVLLRPSDLRAEDRPATSISDERVVGANGAVQFADYWRRHAAQQQQPNVVLAAYREAVEQNGATTLDPNAHLLPELDEPGAVNVAPAISDSNEAANANSDSPTDLDGTANLDVQPKPLSPAEAERFAQYRDHPIVYNLLADERNFYRCASLEWLAVGLGVSGILANTHADQGFRDFYSETFRPADRDLDFLKQFGNGGYVIPALAAIWVVDFEIDSYADENHWWACVWLQEWSGRSMRGLIVGAVPVLSLQYILGSARPNANTTSRWEPFKSTHGVSGHAFVCAVPFWTAAQMTDCWMLEAGFYTMGTMAGWSRIHTDTHYLSQVLMGWWLAGLSVSAVNHTQLETHEWYVTPTIDDGSVGIYLVRQR